MTICETKTI